MEVKIIILGLIILILGIGVLIAGADTKQGSFGFFFAGGVISICSLILIFIGISEINCLV